jgi:hypothetical protein
MRSIYPSFGLALALAAGCASDPGDKMASQSTTSSSAGAGTRVNVQARCEQWVDKFCARYAACSVQEQELEQSDLATFISACKPRLVDTVMCSDAVQIRSTYDACLHDLEVINCAVLIDDDSELPPNCKGLILVP